MCNFYNKKGKDLNTLINFPNILTLFRIFGSAFLLFTEPMSKAFFIIYTACGVSDALDGLFARIMRKCTEIGAKLDSAADLIYYSVLLFKIIPVLNMEIPSWIFTVSAVILLFRIGTYLLAAIKFKKFASMHTYLNKLCGLVIFLTPYMMGRSFTAGYCITVCAVAFLSSFEEFVIHIISQSYNPKRKSAASLFLFKNNKRNA